MRGCRPARLTLAAALAFACSALLGACVSYGPGALQPGDSIEAVTQRMGRPTGDYHRADGGQRLEFARGPFGKHTFMLDFDPQGRLQHSEQVLDEAHFNTVQAGMTGDQLLFRLGHPLKVWSVRYHDQTVWSYRFDGPFCQLFHVGITPAGDVEDTSYGPDPLCERKDPAQSR